MQILPNNADIETPAFLKADGSAYEIPQSSPFASLMESISNKAKVQASAMDPASQLEAQRQALLQEKGQHGVGQGARVSREDFAAISYKLKQQGVSDRYLEDMREQVNSEEGLTWRELLEKAAEDLNVSSQEAPPEITQRMRLELDALFRKMGFSEQDSKDLINDLKHGRQRQVWHALSKQANLLDADSLENITKGELKNLAAALGLSGKSLQRLDNMLAGDPKASLSPKGTQMVLDTIFNESAKAQHQLEEKLGKLRALIEQGQQLAKQGKDLQALSDNRESKEVTSAKVLIKDEAEKNYGGSGSEAAQAAKKQKEAQQRQQNEVQDDAETKADSEKLKTRLFGDTPNDQNKGQKEQNQHNAPQKDADRKAFDQMWGRVSIQNQGEATFKQAENIVNQNFSPNAKFNPEISLGDKVPPQSIARNVQNGILQNLQQGGKQLTLRLDPPSLGKLSVILQVHNNEVRATIRTENAEAARLVNDQLSTIRQTLEQQGLKVEKLDVQTQMHNNDQNRNWQGTDQHNMSQERNRDSLRSALRNWQNRGADNEDMAHDMQNTPEGESISQQGIHLIA